MFQAGNQECSNLCLVVAGDLPTAHGFYKSWGVLSGLGVVQLQIRSNVHRQGCAGGPGVKLLGAGLPFKADSWKWVKKQQED